MQGNIERGDGQQIDCAILYFKCNANTVDEHGGEVLKFIGDCALTIFPFDDATRPRANICAAAMASAQEALCTRRAH